MGGNTRRLGSLGAILGASQHSLFLFLLEHKLEHTTDILAQHLTPGCSVAQSCPTLFDPMNHSMPGLPVHYQLLEFIQTHVH